MTENTTMRLKKPLTLFVLAGFAFAYTLFFKVYFRPQLSSIATITALLGFVLIYSQHKVLWTISISWLLISIVMTLLNTFGNGYVGSPEFAARIGFIAVDVLCLLGIAFYFRAPYVKNRVSLTGFGERRKASLDAILRSATKEAPVKVVNVSSSGLGLQADSAHISSLGIAEGSVYEVVIPELYSFQSKVTLVRKDGNFLGVRLQGWTPGSILQHSKILFWLSKNGKLSDQKGFTLAEAMIVCGVFSILVLGLSQVFADITRTSRQSDLLYQVYSINEEIAWALRNPVAWNNTLNDTNNAGLECVRNRTTCSAIKTPVSINVRNGSNTVIVNSLTATQGFDWNGTPCNQFDSGDGSDACPLRFVVQAQAVCDGICTNPSLKLSVSPQFNPRTKTYRLNTSKLITYVFKDVMVDSLAATCASLNGTFDAGTGACSFDVFSAACESTDQYLVGVEDGKPVCEDVKVAVLCPAGQWIRGFDNNGNAICASI